MAVDLRKRQKKLEKQKAKKKAEQKAIARRQSQGMPARMEAASKAPILHCLYTTSLWEEGMGQVLISRQLSGGNVAFVAFLVDAYCLGVKNVHLDIVPQAVYDRQVYDRLLSRYATRHVTPEYVRKLVESAVEYARALGLPPHPDYRIAKLIFGDISAKACPEEFEFGKDGKPLFIAGPHDDEARCWHIVHTIENVCGPGGSHFIMPLSPNSEMLHLSEVKEDE